MMSEQVLSRTVVVTERAGRKAPCKREIRHAVNARETFAKLGPASVVAQHRDDPSLEIGDLPEREIRRQATDVVDQRAGEARAIASLQRDLVVAGDDERHRPERYHANPSPVDLRRCRLPG